VAVVGVGATPVAKSDRGLRQLACLAVREALADAGVDRVSLLVVGNMLAPQLQGQGHLGPVLADDLGLRGIEAFTVDAACASGAVAFRQACLAVASGAYELAAAVGVEKMTGMPGPRLATALATAADVPGEGAHGATFPALNALIMRRYQHDHGLTRESFAGFAINAHANAAFNPRAMFPRRISLEEFMASPVVADPLAILDSSPIADGAAAAVVRRVGAVGPRGVRLRASAVATDSTSLHDREDPLWLSAAAAAANLAYREARVDREDLDFFELHDAFSIIAALSLEACGFAARGRATELARSGEIGLHGRIPISTRGGLKARGHPVGATGLYQIVEAVEQLRGDAGDNQVVGASLGMTQNIGGSGATVVTHILEATG
jgi:acetyl-CoA C-acetyltransferase